MVDPELLHAAASAALRWDEVRQAVTVAAQACTQAVTCLWLAGDDPDGPAVRAAQAAVAELAEMRRHLDFGEAVIEAERARAADEALAGAGLARRPPGRHLHAVS